MRGSGLLPGGFVQAAAQQRRPPHCIMCTHFWCRWVQIVRMVKKKKKMICGSNRYTELRSLRSRPATWQCPVLCGGGSCQLSIASSAYRQTVAIQLPTRQRQQPSLAPPGSLPAWPQGITWRHRPIRVMTDPLWICSSSGSPEDCRAGWEGRVRECESGSGAK